MARKSSDLFTLLQSRGGGRGASGRPGILGQVTGWLNGLFGKRRYHDGGARRAMQFSSTALMGIVFASLGVGYLLGDAFPLAGKAALRRGGPQDPGPVRPKVINTGGAGLEAFRLDPAEECQPMAKQGFLLDLYGDSDADRSSAADLALQLRAEGLATARPFRFWSGANQFWTVMAYYNDAAAAEKVRERVVAAAGSHSELAAFRKLVESQKAEDGQKRDWPFAVKMP